MLGLGCTQAKSSIIILPIELTEQGAPYDISVGDSNVLFLAGHPDVSMYGTELVPESVIMSVVPKKDDIDYRWSRMS